MVAESPAKFKPKLPQSTQGVGYLPMAMPRQREPYLYPFKLPLVVLTLTSLATVALSPWPRYQNCLWLLVFFSSCSLFSVTCQAIRMISTVRKYRAMYVHGSGSSSINSSHSSSNLSSTKETAGAKVVVVDIPARPGHKKAVRSKGHRSSISLDALDSCDQTSESVALVVDCQDWSDSTNSSGSDWQAGPPRWNHAFVIPNYKEVRPLQSACGAERCDLAVVVGQAYEQVLHQVSLGDLEGLSWHRSAVLAICLVLVLMVLHANLFCGCMTWHSWVPAHNSLACC